MAVGTASVRSAASLRFGSLRRERWRTRGARVEGEVVGGGRREVLEALREGGPTKREGAGRRFDVVLVMGVVEVIVLRARCIFTCWVVVHGRS